VRLAYAGPILRLAYAGPILRLAYVGPILRLAYVAADLSADTTVSVFLPPPTTAVNTAVMLHA
jgi:hypothetical protein